MNNSNFLTKFINRFKLFISIILGRITYFYKGLKKYDLIIFDNIYPHPVSGFRLEEFTSLLTTFEKSKILLSPDSYPTVATSKELHPIHIDDLLTQNPNLKGKLKLLKGFVNINTKLFYCVFINNIYRFLDVLEKNEIPFVFTLYPGGGFAMDNEVCDTKLKKVLSSKMFRKVIVTQKITHSYLLEKKFCNHEQIQYIFGGVVPQNSLIKDTSKKKYYMHGKNTLDICFCAAKYMPKGIDKGYDVFIELAHAMVLQYSFIRFHVIGGFDENDIDISAIKEYINFYGYQKFEALENIFHGMDIIISPNKPFVLMNGAFDGFPLGTVIEAALNGVMIILSDGLQQNTTFVDQQELIIVESNSKYIQEIIEELISEPNKIKAIATAGQQKFRNIYSNKVQMDQRIELLKKYM